MAILDLYQFKQVKWSTTSTDILEIRRKVFLIEQRFDQQALNDHFDASCYHILVQDFDNKPIACGRLNLDGRISRIAVLIAHRNQGIGTLILSKLIRIAQQNELNRIFLNAETELTHFYDQLHFHPDGPVYMKQGVPFQRMTKSLA